MRLSADIARWYGGLAPQSLPADVAQATKLRILDVLGVVLAATETSFGDSVRRAAVDLGGGCGESRILGYGDRVSAAAAAFANGSLASALDFDDTHNQTIIHISSPTVVTALALAPVRRIDGSELVVAVAGASEVMCRLGMTAPGAWQRRGFHPTAITGAFGAALVASRMLGLSPLQMGHALGIAGSQAAGLMESWVDGATVRYAHGGWAAHSGIAAAYIARAGITGPAAVFEGRYGLLATHMQNASDEVVPSRLVDGLGVDWESRRTSFKPYPAAHVLHSFIDALLHLQREEGLSARDVKRVVCRVADYMVPLVCEPAAERLRPSNDSTARVSLQYTIAETFVRGGLDARSYDAGSLRDPEILSLADKVAYEIDESAPGRERFKGWVVVETVDGRVLERVEDYNRGSAERPLSQEEVREKFVRNASARLKPEAIAQVVDMVDRLPKVHNIEDLVSSCCSDDVCRTDPARTL